MRTFAVVNDQDPNIEIDLGEQVDLLDAAYAALSALGFTLVMRGRDPVAGDLDTEWDEDDEDEDEDA